MGDFNGLKILNDAFGHDLGDEALRRIAGVLTVDLPRHGRDRPHRRRRIRGPASPTPARP
ncbi:MAG: GGDEF domain-containing protein [Bacillus subtilis]|nr:GGDEF domain-containing protein [Bacillus subtilis]